MMSQKFLNILSVSGSFFFLYSCAIQPKKISVEPAVKSERVVSISEIQSYKKEETSAADTQSFLVSPIPVETNALVDQWIRYFQGRGRPHMERYLARSARYGDLMKRILRENGMPEDLIYIALIESGFSSRAVSHASAVGYWQFIKGTGRRYQLEVSTLVDERRDPVLSTQAAASYFKDLYAQFNSWYLAMAGYNAGENRIQRLVQKHGTRDFWELASKRKTLPKETIHYVPKYIAAKLIAKNPEQYGFKDIEYEDPIEFELIQVEHPVDLRAFSQELQIDYDDLKILNPKFKGPLAPLGRDNRLHLRVPYGRKDLALASVNKAKVDIAQFVHYKSDDVVTYRVRRGDTLGGIARRHRTTVKVIAELNDIRMNRRLRVGQRLDVPRLNRVASKSPASAKASQGVTNSVATASTNSETNQNVEVVASQEAKPRYHIVQKGDTLTGIAEEYEITIGEIVKLNKLRKRALLPVGLRLKLPEVESLPVVVDEKEGLRRSSRRPSSSKPDFVYRSRKQRTEASSRGIARMSPMPIKKVHVVKKGETLQRIASRYRLSISKIASQNNISNPYHIQVGQRILIPHL